MRADCKPKSSPVLNVPMWLSKKSFKTLWIITYTMLGIQRYDSQVDPMGKQIGQRLWCAAYVITSRSEESLWRLVSLNLTQPKIIYFTTHDDNYQNFGQKTGFEPITYVHELPIIMLVFISLHIKKKPISMQKYNRKKFRCSNHIIAYKFREVIVFSNTIPVVRLGFLQFHFHRENNQTMRTREMPVILRHCCMY